MVRCTLQELFLVILYCLALFVITYVIMNDYEMVDTEYVEYAYPTGKLSDRVLKGVVTKELYEGGFQAIGENVCPKDGANIKLLVVIQTRFNHVLRRQATRKTWGHFAMRTDVSMGFLMGRLGHLDVVNETRKEQFYYEDLIINNNIDTYRNLTLKSTSMLEFVSTYCRKVLHVIKTDDDIFLNVPAVIKYMMTINSSVRAIYGRYDPNREPDRKIDSKHYVSYELYNKTTYPQFLLGAGYIFTPSIAEELFTVALNLTYFPCEDAFITGFCAEAIKLRRISSEIFYDFLRRENRTTVKKLVNMHQAKPYSIWFLLHKASVKKVPTETNRNHTVEI